LGTLCSIRTGFAFKTFKNDPGGTIHMLQPKDLQEDGTLNKDEIIHVRPSEIALLSNHLLQVNDILVVNKGKKFNVHLYDGTPVKAVATSAFYIITPTAATIHPEYLYWFLTHAEVKEYFLLSSTGSVIPSITKSVLSELSVPLIPMTDQEHICSFNKAALEEQKILKELLEKKEAYSAAYTREYIHQCRH